VKLVAPEAVKPFVKKGKKNDAADAAAIMEGGRTNPAGAGGEEYYGSNISAHRMAFPWPLGEDRENRPRERTL
jgi:hypothetical protein